MPIPDVSDRSILDLVSLKNRNAVVTGGARGIGYAICNRLAEAGANIIIGDINADAAEKAAGLLARHKVSATGAWLDVADGASIAALADRVVRDLGSIDIWVNNAGVVPSLTLMEMTEQDWNRVLDINLRGTFLGAQEAGRRMLDAGNGGVIINLASLAGFSAYGTGFVHYTSSKHGVVGLTKALAVELGPHNIRVVAVAPTLTQTPGLEEGMVAYREAGLGDLVDQMAQREPLRRTAIPDDIARVVFFLASDLAMLMTGSTVLVDAGDRAV